MGEPSLGPEERAELEYLRAEVAELRGRRVRWRGPGWRGPVAVLLITVGCLLAPLSVLAVWTANHVSNTSRYVANVTPPVRSTAIQNALTDKITYRITTLLNAAGLINRAAALPSRCTGCGGPVGVRAAR
jgi:hypothetical protein